MNDAAPLGQERRTPATRRLRRRGPRSQLALLRRSVPKERRKLPDISPGEAGDSMSDDLIINKSHVQINKNDVFIYSLNIRCLLAHLDELTSFLNDHRPHIVFLQETWLEESVSDIKIPGYTTISRRDRHASTNRGRIISLQRDDFNCLVHIADSSVDERS